MSFREYLDESVTKGKKKVVDIINSVVYNKGHFSHDDHSEGWELDETIPVGRLVNKLVKVEGLYGNPKAWGSSSNGMKHWQLEGSSGTDLYGLTVVVSAINNKIKEVHVRYNRYT